MGWEVKRSQISVSGPSRANFKFTYLRLEFSSNLKDFRMKLSLDKSLVIFLKLTHKLRFYELAKQK